MNKLGIYIHIPFCLSRCRYCGFYSNAMDETSGSLEAQKTYVQWLIGKIRDQGARYGRKYAVDTIFIGGGTPSILSVEMIEAIIGAVRESFAIESGAEITIESNPKTLTPQKLKRYRMAGINRLSIGLQSFDDDILRSLGRAHNVEDFMENYRMARKCGFDNINIDLMFAIPGQTKEQWLATVDRAIELEPEHISFYSLQIEEDTPFYDDYLSGELIPVADDIDREMYHEAISKLKDAGYVHYEISNAAKPGYECRHNLKYWSFDEYLGLGDSASSFMEGIRFTEKPREEYHENDFDDNTGEFVFTGLRKTEGISKEEFEDRFGRAFWDVYEARRPRIREFFDSGLLIEEDDVLRLSEEGIDVSNQIMSMFV